MKTIDDVIKAYEVCHASVLDCNGCPYDNGMRYRDSDCYIADALHYLKEYRSEKAMWEADRKGYLNWIEQYKEAREKHQQAVIELKRNPPLTWDELKAMRGKPIWIELLGNDHWKGWDVIAGFDEDDFGIAMVTVHNDDYYKLDLCKTWQAYRKERE